VKRNALAALSFTSFRRWKAPGTVVVEADERDHGTTHEKPRERFQRDERTALRALPANPPPVRQRRVSWKVAID
jgi:hypothetical protein